MNPSILLIEDARDTGMILIATFGKDYRVSHAMNLIEARKELTKGMPDVILLDANLPDGDGFSFCTWLKKDARYRSIPVVFVTGRTDKHEKDFGMSLGAEGYITKPFHPKQIRAYIDEFLAKRPKKRAA